jgi:hypothetical protein
LTVKPARRYTSTTFAIVVAGVLVSASLPFALGEGTKTVTVSSEDTVTAVNTTTVTSTATITTTTTVTTSCSPAATQENSLYTFRTQVIYNGPWNATATGYTNSGVHQAFTECYTGNGTGWILIAGWNAQGGNILNMTVQKLDSSNGNLTAVLFGQVRTTTAPYGSVKVSAIAVP